ncbi:MAG: DUF1841 family protein [Gammaproteobacteria bacterium]|nr:DUF1841 family protein [Gammaproteobacteria bacterium]
MFSNNRDQLRQFYCEVWRKHGAGLALEPLEGQIRDVILLHPEYHTLLEQPERALGRDYLPEFGETNPFLHMGLHLAIHEQLGTDRPAGIRALIAELHPRWPDRHALEHQMMECLAESLWRSQRDGIPPDEAVYLDCLRRQCAR